MSHELLLNLGLMWPLEAIKVWGHTPYPRDLHPYTKRPIWGSSRGSNHPGSYPFLLIIIRVENLNSNQTKPPIKTLLVLTRPLSYAVRRPTKKRPKKPHPLPPHPYIYIYEYWTCSLQRKVKIAENLNNDQTKHLI